MGKQTAGRDALGGSPRNLRNGMTACFLERSGPWLRCDHPRRGEALARRQEGQLVPSGSRGVPGEGRSSKWLEPVSDEAYAVIVRDDFGEA